MLKEGGDACHPCHICLRRANMEHMVRDYKMYQHSREHTLFKRMIPMVSVLSFPGAIDTSEAIAGEEDKRLCRIPWASLAYTTSAHGVRKLADTGKYMQKKGICMVISLSVNISKDRRRHCCSFKDQLVHPVSNQ